MLDVFVYMYYRLFGMMSKPSHIHCHVCDGIARFDSNDGIIYLCAICASAVSVCVPCDDAETLDLADVFVQTELSPLGVDDPAPSTPLHFERSMPVPDLSFKFLLNSHRFKETICLGNHIVEECVGHTMVHQTQVSLPQGKGHNRCTFSLFS